MISRSIFRCAHQPLKQTIPSTRRYATNLPPGTPPKGPTQISTIVVGGSTVAAIFGVMYYFGAPSKKASAPSSTSPAKGSGASEAHPVSDTPAPKAFLGGDQGFFDLKLESIETVNHNVKKLRFALPSDEHVSGLSVASAILTKFKGPNMEKPVIRPYTPVSDEDSKGYIDFQIKRYPNGPMSEHMHDMKPDQRLSFKGPIPKYPWTENKHNHIALIAGGTGITPMFQLTRAIFNNPSDTTKVTLVFGNISEEDILLKHEFEELENQYPQRFRAFYTLNNPSDGWQMGKGHIDEELLKTVLPEPKEENIKVFVCGPPGLYKAISGAKKSPSDQGELDGILKKLGYTQEQVYKF